MTFYCLSALFAASAVDEKTKPIRSGSSPFVFTRG
jgi:hypothetical protein